MTARERLAALRRPAPTPAPRQAVARADIDSAGFARPEDFSDLLPRESVEAPPPSKHLVTGVTLFTAVSELAALAISSWNLYQLGSAMGFPKPLAASLILVFDVATVGALLFLFERQWSAGKLLAPISLWLVLATACVLANVAAGQLAPAAHPAGMSPARVADLANARSIIGAFASLLAEVLGVMHGHAHRSRIVDNRWWAASVLSD
jgi:hypothetical protein